MAGLFTLAEYESYARTAAEGYAARKGASQISFADQSVSFSTWKEIWDWLSWVRSNVDTGRSRTRYVATSKGC